MKKKSFNVVLLWLLLLTCKAQDLPNSLSITIDDPKVGSVQLSLYKFNQRSEDFKAYFYENGQLTEFTPGPCRVYRGWSDTYENSQVTAVIYPNNVLYGKIDFGKGDVNSIPLEAIQLPAELQEASLPYVSMPQKAEHHATMGFTTDTGLYYDVEKANGNKDVMVAMWENALNELDLCYASNVGLSFELKAVVIPLDLPVDEAYRPEDDPDCPFWTNVFFRTFGSGGVAGRGSFCNGYKGGRTGMNLAGAKAFAHEFGHCLDLGHDHNEWDTMSSNHYFLGFESRHNVKQVLVNGQVGATNNDCVKNNNVTYTDPLRPYAALDVTLTDENTEVQIDVLANDFDGNQDALRIKSVDALSKNGGTCSVVGNRISYTPPAGYLGRDYFYYEVESGEPNSSSYLYNYAQVIIEVRHNNDLILHYGFEEPSGNFVFDNATQVADYNGILIDGNFTANSSSGVVGKALQLNGSTQFVKMKACVDPVDMDMTYALWFNPSTIPTSKTGMTLFDTGNRGLGDHSGLNIKLLPNSISVKANPINQDRVPYYKEQTVSWQTNTWYHVALVIDRTASTMRAYLDGVEITDTENFTPYTAEQIIIGHFGEIPKKDVAASAIGCNGSRSSEDFFHGKVDELKVFKSALSESAIIQLYNDRTVNPFVCNAGLKNPVVDNNSFEISTVKYTYDVWPIADHWFYSSPRKVRVAWGDNLDLYPQAIDGYNWLKMEGGHEVYQAIGVYEPNMKLNVSLGIGAAFDSPMGECEVSFLTGEANVDLGKTLSDQGLTVLAVKTFKDKDLRKKKAAVKDFVVDLGSNGESCMPLYILIKNNDLENKLLVDHIQIVQSTLKSTSFSIKDEQEENSTISIYPNPCTDGLLNVEVNEILSGTSDYKLTDQKGVTVKEGVIPVNCSKMGINVSNLSPGLYFLSYINSRGSTVTKIVIR